jgi:outer membrane cobalamin receptor
MYRNRFFLSLKNKIFLPVGILFLFFSISFAQEENKEKEKEQKIITEEITVEAQHPKEVPLSATSLIKRDRIEAIASTDLSEVLSYTSGTFVSSGAKNEFRLKLRGLGSQRIALLYNGIPIYEPYFNSFDLKTITAEEVESIKVVKGASSVLYGPNALGGIVNIITRRPNSPSFSLKTSYDSNNTFHVSSTAAFNWKNLFFSGFTSYKKSPGFRWNKEGENVPRANSDHEMKNVTGKIYFYPNRKSEILFESVYYSSEFGIPFATAYLRPRYWRFKNWNRFQLHLGGTFSLFNKGHLKLRSYYVRHDNTLDAYTAEDMRNLEWESTYNNDSYGVFIIGSMPYLPQNNLKFSINFRNDKARTQDDRGKEWEEFKHQTFSIGVENHYDLNRKWKLIGGASFDHLKKQSGEAKSTINPIIGVKFNPQEYLDLHLSFAQKSRFPSMKSLYIIQTGNPELKDERGTNIEFGFTYNKNINIKGAVFYNQIKDLIDVIRLPDGSKTNLNIGKADITGFELEFQKNLRRVNFSLNYTYLDGENKEENRPLDLLPKSQLNFDLNFMVTSNLKLSLWGLNLSSSEVELGEDVFKIPGYFIVNGVLSKRFSNFTIFLKAENLFNRYYMTEPGFPLKARTVAVGLKFNAGQTMDKWKSSSLSPSIEVFKSDRGC